ncbi:BTB/POZ domain-containing protein 6-like isoform X3 [Dermacentor albipictus]|uniref:BTB/POZ domain-containing protein 6-like isoform X3 n=1 Tax=Dermacentor albipictus TaxID=60249 RepID=UPI0038FC1575
MAQGRPAKRGAAAPLPSNGGITVTSSVPKENEPTTHCVGGCSGGDRAPAPHRERGRAPGSRGGGRPAAFTSAMAAPRRARSRCTQTDPVACGCASYPPAVRRPPRPSAPPLPEDLRRLAEPPDVRLAVGPQPGEARSVPVHAAVLSQSAVLRDLLARCSATGVGCQPEADARTRTLRVVWADPDAFEKMMPFLYGRDVRLDDVSSALDVMRVAHAFAVPGLLTVCLRYVGDHVDRETALSALTRLCEVSGGGPAADLQQNLLNETRARCLDVVDRNAEWLLADAAFECLPRTIFALVLGRDSLWLRSEVSAAKGADRWAAAECRRQGDAAEPAQKRRVLGDTAYLVRHFLLDRDQFRRAAPSLLDDIEAALVLEFMDGRIGEDRLTPALRTNLALRRRPSPPALPPSSPPAADSEPGSAPATGPVRSQTLARNRKSTSAKGLDKITLCLRRLHSSSLVYGCFYAWTVFIFLPGFFTWWVRKENKFYVCITHVLIRLELYGHRLITHAFTGYCIGGTYCLISRHGA